MNRLPLERMKIERPQETEHRISVDVHRRRQRIAIFLNQRVWCVDAAFGDLAMDAGIGRVVRNPRLRRAAMKTPLLAGNPY